MSEPCARKRVRRFMCKPGQSETYHAPMTNRPHPEHRTYPDLLRELVVGLPKHVCCADIADFATQRRLPHFSWIMRWANRKLLSWWLSNAIDSDLGVTALEEALARYGVRNPNTDQSGHQSIKTATPTD
ncbi:MAG: hypothetical protein ACR2PA_18390 [Hyphomicrobiaceae bacterium]